MASGYWGNGCIMWTLLDPMIGALVIILDGWYRYEGTVIGYTIIPHGSFIQVSCPTSYGPNVTRTTPRHRIIEVLEWGNVDSN